MTAQQAFQSQPNAARHSKSFNRLVGIARTGRLIAATSREQNRQIRFVESHRKQRGPHSCMFPRKACTVRSHVATGIHYTPFSTRNKSAVSAANSARAAELFGCMTMSHPAGISSRWQRTISRRRLRIRLRTTAPPRAFLMLKPNRLCGSALARKKTVKWELERRFPAR